MTCTRCHGRMWLEDVEWCCMACGARVQVGAVIELSLKSPTRVIGALNDSSRVCGCGAPIAKRNQTGLCGLCLHGEKVTA